MNGFRNFIKWGLYPFSWLAILCLFYLAILGKISFQQAYGYLLPGLVISYLFLEYAIPFEKKWSMTWRSLFSDLKYLVVNGSTIAVVATVLGFFAITTSGQSNGYASGWPMGLQIAAILLAFELVNYSMHRLMHEARGKIGSFLWKSHAAHHLPDKVYIFMHVAGHPINTILTQVLSIILPIWLMGYDQSVVTLFLMINAMHGLISHFNVDARLGYFNYLFVGPELHRYHHSAKMSEAKNYGATLSVYDQLFGTFVYRPGCPPEELGISQAQNYPAYNNIISVMKLPFTRVK